MFRYNQPPVNDLNFNGSLSLSSCFTKILKKKIKTFIRWFWAIVTHLSFRDTLCPPIRKSYDSRCGTISRFLFSPRSLSMYSYSACRRSLCVGLCRTCDVMTLIISYRWFFHLVFIRYQAGEQKLVTGHQMCKKEAQLGGLLLTFKYEMKYWKNLYTLNCNNWFN